MDEGACVMVFLLGVLCGLVFGVVLSNTGARNTPYTWGERAGHCAGWCEAQGYPGGVLRGSDCACLARVEDP